MLINVIHFDSKYTERTADAENCNLSCYFMKSTLEELNGSIILKAPLATQIDTIFSNTESSK